MAHQVGNALGGLAVQKHPLLGLFHGGQADLDLVPPIQTASLPVHQSGRFPLRHHFPVGSGAVAPAQRKKVHGLQQVGLAAAVRPVKHSDPLAGFQFQIGIIAELLQAKGGKVHEKWASLSSGDKFTG